MYSLKKHRLELCNDAYHHWKGDVCFSGRSYEGCQIYLIEVRKHDKFIYMVLKSEKLDEATHGRIGYCK